MCLSGGFLQAQAYRLVRRQANPSRPDGFKQSLDRFL